MTILATIEGLDCNYSERNRAYTYATSSNFHVKFVLLRAGSSMLYPPRIGDVAVLLVQKPCHERSLLVAMLRDGGLRSIGLANDILPAALTIRRLRPDVILVDLDSVGNGGLALAGGLDELAGGPPPVVALKWEPTMTFVARAHAQGAAAVLAKPYSRAALWRRIAEPVTIRPRDVALS